MRSLILAALLVYASDSFAYTLESFCDEVYKHDLFVVDIEGEKLAVKYDKEAAMAFEPLSLEFGNRRITTDESKKEQESSAMLGFSTKMPWLRASEKKIYLSKEKGLLISEQLQKTILKSEVKRLYVSLLLFDELENIYSQKKYIAEASYKAAKKKFESGRISNMELARFDAELSQSGIDLSSASAQKEELHHALSHMVLSHDEIVITDLGFVFYKNLEEKLGGFAKESLQLKELEAKKQELEAEIGTYKYALVDKVEFGIGYTKEAAQRSVDFRASFPLNITGKNENMKAAARAKLLAITKKQKIIQDMLTMMAKAETQRLRELEKKISVSTQSERLYKSVFDMTAKGYENGVVSVFEYLNAKNGYFDALAKTITYKKEYVEEIAKLEKVFTGVIK